MQVALWTWGYRVADSLSFAAGAEMSGTELQRLHGEKVTRAAKLFQDALHRRFLWPS